MRKFIDDENTLIFIRFVPICIARVAVSEAEIVTAFVGTSRTSASASIATVLISGGILNFVFVSFLASAARY